MSSDLIKCYRRLEDVIQEAREHCWPGLPVKLPKDLKRRLDERLEEFSIKLVKEIKPNHDPSRTLKDATQYVKGQARTEEIQIDQSLVKNIVLSTLYCQNRLQPPPTVRLCEVPVHLDDPHIGYRPYGLEIRVGETSIALSFPPQICTSLLYGATIGIIGTILSAICNEPTFLIPTVGGIIGSALVLGRDYNIEKYKDQIIKYNFLFCRR